MHKNKLFIIIAVLALFVQVSKAQNNTNSPLTRFGFGEISENSSGEQRAMGGAAIAQRKGTGINTVNPASYSAVDSLTFMLDFGTSALYSRLSDATQKKNAFNANLEYLTMQFRLFKGVGFSTGLLPYSFSGYNFNTTDSLQNSFGNSNDYTKYRSDFKGSGGFSQFYTGLSVDLFNHISLGANLYYMFGTVNNERHLNILEKDKKFIKTIQTNSIEAKNFRLRYGLQYYDTFSEKHNFTLGLIYEPKTKLNANAKQITVGSREILLDISKDFELPQIFGGGLHYNYNEKLSVGLDYSLQQWKNAKHFGRTDTLSNASKIALGFEYQPNYRGRKFTDRMIYRAGIKLSDSYYKINSDNAPKNFGISFGVGMPLRSQSRTMLNMAFEYGRINSAGTLKEDYFKLTFNFALTESWFYKQKL